MAVIADAHMDHGSLFVRVLAPTQEPDCYSLIDDAPMSLETLALIVNALGFECTKKA